MANKKIAVKSRVFAVEKSKDHVMFTGTVLIPGEPDCDFDDGEEVLSEAKVAKMAHEYMENYRIVDKNHDYFETGEEVGKPVESHLLSEPTVIKSIDGNEREYPKGTWVAKSRITDPVYMAKAEKGEIFYSVTALSKAYADKLMAAKSRTLIKHLGEDAVGFTLSFVENPCVDNSCSIKAKAAMKAGKKISKQNKSIVEKARDTVNEAMNTLNSLIDSEAKDNGGNKVSEKDKKEFVTKSDLVGFKDEILEAVKAAPVKPDPKAATPAATTPSGAKCPKCDATVGPKDKFCKVCGAALKAAKSKDDVEDVDLEETKSIKNHDDKKEKVAFKSIEHYAGRTRKGRPAKKDKK